MADTSVRYIRLNGSSGVLPMERTISLPSGFSVGKYSFAAKGLPRCFCQVSMKSFCNSPTTGPSSCRSVSRHGRSFLSTFRSASPLEDPVDPVEYTLLMLMPPIKAMRPSTTSNLRWSRLLISHGAVLSNGLTGLNSSTKMPAWRSRSKKALGVLMPPMLS